MKLNKKPKSWRYFVLTSLMLYINNSHAQNISFTEAESQFMQNSYSNQAFQNLEQASKLASEAVKGLGLPQIDFNVRAISYRADLNVPLADAKKGIGQGIITNVNQNINQWANQNGIPSQDSDVIKQLAADGIKDGIGLIPNSYDTTLKDEMIRPSVSMIMPIYTGGITTSTKNIAKIAHTRSQLSTQEQQDLLRFELIQVYFNVQLQKQLLSFSQNNYKAMQTHYGNALKLEQQGFINRGQRLQFEVAKNNAERLQQSTQAALQASLFHFNNMLHSSDITQLSTPLFVNTTTSLDLNQLLKSYSQQSVLVKKLEADTALSEENIKIQQATKKPKVFAFGEYSLEKNNDWIVGMAAQYNLFSGINKTKSIQVAEQERSATLLLTEQAKQNLENVIYKSYSELNTAQQSDALIQSNFKAAQENLRIQQLSFQEDMGTATQVIDAQNIIYALQTESAINAYKYILSLATLLQSHGSIQQFQTFIHQPHTRFIQ